MDSYLNRPARVCDDNGDLRPQFEQFVWLYMMTNDHIEAYIEAVAIDKNMARSPASRLGAALLRQPAIRARIAEIMEEFTDTAMVTLTSVTKELNESRALAMTLNQPAAATQATMAKAKLHGLDRETVWLSGPNNGPVQTLDVSKLDTDTLAKLRAAKIVDDNASK